MKTERKQAALIKEVQAIDLTRIYYVTALETIRKGETIAVDTKNTGEWTVSKVRKT